MSVLAPVSNQPRLYRLANMPGPTDLADAFAKLAVAPNTERCVVDFVSRLIATSLPVEKENSRDFVNRFKNHSLDRHQLEKDFQRKGCFPLASAVNPMIPSRPIDQRSSPTARRSRCRRHGELFYFHGFKVQALATSFVHRTHMI
jgi:hypothetical protein